MTSVQTRPGKNRRKTPTANSFGPAGERVVARIKECMADETLPPDTYLPAERVMAERFDCSRGTIRVALQRLEEEGALLRVGARRRAPPRKRVQSVMTDTVAILTLNPGELLALQAAEGWERFIDVGAAQAVAERGLHMLGLYLEQLTEAPVKRLLEHPPLGLIVGAHVAFSPLTHKLVTAMQRIGVPVVLYGDNPEQRDFDRVVSNHEQGTRDLVAWLCRERGRKRILRFWAGMDIDHPPYWLGNRDRGYLEAMREHGCEPLPPICFRCGEPTWSNLDFEQQVRLMAGYLMGFSATGQQAPPDALLAVSDNMLPALGAACELHGWRPGHDLDLVGYDNYWSQAPTQRHKKQSPVATVDKHNREIGRRMVELLLQRANEELPPEPQTRLVEQSLVVVEPEQNH